MTKTLTIICWAITALVLIALIVWFLTGNIFGVQTDFSFNNFDYSGGDFYNGRHDKVYEYTVSAKDISSLKVDWISGTVTITPYSGEDIIVTEYANRDLEENEQLVLKESGRTLVVEYCAMTRFVTNMSKLLEIKIPESLVAKLADVEVDAVSADIKIDMLTLEKLNLSVVSGDISLVDMSMTLARLDSTSGDFRLNAVDVDDLFINTVSGTTRTESSWIRKFKGDSTSGDFILEGTIEEIDISTVSGGAKITSGVVPEKVKCDTMSGDVDLFIPAGDAISVRFDSMSGSLTGDIPMMLVKSGGYSFDSVSGDVTISRKAD